MLDALKFQAGLVTMLRNIVQNSGGTVSDIEIDGYSTSITDFAVTCLAPDLSMSPFEMDLPHLPDQDGRV